MIWSEEGDSTEVQIVYRLWYVSLSRIVCFTNQEERKRYYRKGWRHVDSKY